MQWLRDILLGYVLVGLCFSTLALAQDNQAPKVVQHSPTDLVEVYDGDRVTFSVKMADEQSALQWVSKEKVVCTTAVCTIDTSGWSLGIHNVVMAARNDTGTTSLTFKIRILKMKPGEKPKQIEVPIATEPKKADEAVTLTAKDLTIRARKGLSFVYNEDGKVKILDMAPDKMTWKERFRSSGGILQFGLGEQEEHFLLPGGYASLGTVGERRVIYLEDGKLRSRQISLQKPQWSIVVGEWLQIDGDERIDVIVNTGKNTQKGRNLITRVMTLRGTARVLLRQNPQQAQPTEYLVPAGTTMLFEQGVNEEPLLRLPPNVLSEKIILATTPVYLQPVTWTVSRQQKTSPTATDKDVLVSAFNESVLIAKDMRPKTVDQAIKNAQDAMAQRDAMLVLENLLSFHIAEKNNFTLNFLIGQAYRQLRAYDLAERFLDKATQLRPQSAAAEFELAQLSLEFSRWNDAYDHLSEAADKNYPYNQLLYYYMGYVQYRRDKVFRARENLNQSLWVETSEPIGKATRELIAALEREKSWHAQLRMTALYDSNIFSKSNSVDTPKPMDKAAGAGLGFDLALSSRPVNGEDGYFGFGYEFSYLNWFGSKMRDVDSGYNKIFTEFGVVLGDAKDPVMDINTQIYLASVFVGGQRAVDGIGLSLGLEFPSIGFEPEVFFDLAMHVDPMPNRDDVLDPFLWEIVAPSDRSARVTKLGLGGLLWSDSSRELRARLTTIKNVHSASFVTIDDYAETDLGLHYNMLYTTRVEFLGAMTLGDRTFGESLDNRKDSLLQMKGTSRWYASPFLSLDSWLSITQQNSSRSANKFTKFMLGLGTKLDL